MSHTIDLQEHGHASNGAAHEPLNGHSSNGHAPVALHENGHSSNGHAVWIAEPEVHVEPAPPLEAEPLPLSARLEANAPEPFEDTTVVPFLLPAPTHVRIAVFDTAGREVAVLVDEVLPAGAHRVSFDGGALNPGTYVCEMDMEGFIAVRKMTLLR